MKIRQSRTATVAIVGGIIVALILVLGTMWMGRSARTDTAAAVRSVSLLYLDELAGRREQVVENNLRNRVTDMRAAISLLKENEATDLLDEEHLKAFQARMKRLYSLDRFAFVDARGHIYTVQPLDVTIDDYPFDYRTLEDTSISVLHLSDGEKKVIIAIPPGEELVLAGEKLTVCFIEIDMAEMLSGVSMTSQESGATFCNIYTADGIALSDAVLGGRAAEDNLLEALAAAEFEAGYSRDAVARDFAAGRRGVASFTYEGVQETMAYVPVVGTDWLLTYLIRESVISDRFSAISGGILQRSVLQSALTVLAMVAMFGLILAQTRKTSRLTLEKQTAEAAGRAKQEELEQRLALQHQLLEEEKRRSQQDSMITAMASDYRSVYHVDLDADEAICYRSDPQDTDGYRAGDHFPYMETFARYAETAVDAKYREGFLRFIQPERIREGLKTEPILAYRYLARRAGKEYYEMIRMADAQHDQRDDGHRISVLGIGFTVIDAEMRQAMAQQQALSEALSAAEQASKAKTAFLSSMSHEIRTPMNAIIGLDNIALNDPETPEKTRGYLTRIGASAEHLLSLINDILDMSRIESGRMTLRHEEFSFSRLLESVNTMFSAQCADKGLTYRCLIEGEADDRYVGDKMKLQQVLINILGNAVKFTPAGGRVELTVRRTAQFDGRSTLQFRIADTGIGISPEFLPRIFDTFSQEDSSTTSKYGSSGLGLAITRSIVEMMNGSVQVESEKGKGTVFTVTVTLADAERRTDADTEALRPQDISVLVVDDDPVACEHARLTLSNAGFAVDTAASGAEAVDMARLRHARMTPYHLILVDWKMPGMDGLETTRRIREIAGGESAIIILTAYKWDDILDEAVRAGVDSFLAKPLFVSSVLEEYSSAMQRRRVKQLPASRAELKGRRVLLAEDVQINAEIIQMLLQSREVDTELAENGRVAVDMFSAHPAGYYDAILMDMRMPEMDGLAATRAIRALPRDDARAIPIIALTANAFDEDVQRSMQAGLNAHLSKPVQPDTLFETLESLISPTPTAPEA